jgi:hypothetical protein
MWKTFPEIVIKLKAFMFQLLGSVLRQAFEIAAGAGQVFLTTCSRLGALPWFRESYTRISDSPQ